MNVLLIRHGMTKGNLEKRYVGRTDEGLTASCIAAVSGAWALGAGPSIAGDFGAGGCMEPLKTIYVSPMKRCLMTKELLFPKERYPDVKTVTADGFRECDFGEFEYKNYQELSENAAYMHFIDTLGAEGFPGGETTEEFKRRCVLTFREIVLRELFAERGRTVIHGPGALGHRSGGTLAFVIHGGTIMSVMEEFARPKKEYYSWQVKNLEGFSASISMAADGRLCLTDVAKVCIL